MLQQMPFEIGSLVNTTRRNGDQDHQGSYSKDSTNKVPFNDDDNNESNHLIKPINFEHKTISEIYKVENTA